jgi:iron complex outermembrane recepter protein
MFSTNHISPTIILLLLLSVPFHCYATEDVLNLDLESLMQIKITSAGRKEQNVMDVPAAVYVLDHEDISNSGATSIPEVLRLVPGLSVSRNSSSGWAISSRGFNRTFSNKLLVQIDGRSVYTPAYSGVYWDMQNVALEDIERIEVIRGPGATLWGANAVNGIINIISKQSSDTQGGLVSIAGGNHEKLIATARYGTQFNENTYGRFYIHQHDQDNYTFLSDGSNANDDWKVTQGGFRFDGDVGINDSWTVQGDIYNNDMSQELDYYMTMAPPYVHSIEDDFKVQGHNILARWEHKTSETNTTKLQLYYDYTNRDEIFIEQTNRKIDIDLQQRIQPFDKHDVVWGMGYRYNKEKFGNTFQAQILPESDNTTLISGFVQDEITLLPDQIWLTAGIKIEHNDFTGSEFQPNLRLLWKPQDKHSLWASVSRAARTPSRVERSGVILTSIIEVPAPPTYTTTMPVPVILYGSSNFSSEKMIAYEAGYRYAAAENLSLDLSFYYNRYDALRTFRVDQSTASLFMENGNEPAYAYGAEITTKWVPVRWLTTEFNYSFNDMSVAQEVTGTIDFTIDEGITAPQHQVSSRFNFTLAKNLKLNLLLRYVDAIKFEGLYNLSQDAIHVDAYTEMDANIKWTIKEGVEVTLVGQNLFDPRRLEAVADSYFAPIEVGRSIYGKLTWEF